MPSAALKEKQELIWHSAGYSHVGNVRKTNEDAFLIHHEEGLWTVADGMGGHRAGDVASQTIIDALSKFKRSDDLATNIDLLEEHLQNANQLCRQRGNEKGGVMGSTAALMFVYDPYCFFLWAGDSRIYRLRNQRLEQLTEDHSLVQEMKSLGEITEQEARNHPSSNIITRAIGVKESLVIDIEYATVEDDDYYLLCSDGLYRDVSEDEIVEIIQNHPIEDVCTQLVERALKHGGSDNITAVISHFELA